MVSSTSALIDETVGFAEASNTSPNGANAAAVNGSAFILKLQASAPDGG